MKLSPSCSQITSLREERCSNVRRVIYASAESTWDRTQVGNSSHDLVRLTREPPGLQSSGLQTNANQGTQPTPLTPLTVLSLNSSTKSFPDSWSWYHVRNLMFIHVLKCGVFEMLTFSVWVGYAGKNVNLVSIKPCSVAAWISCLTYGPEQKGRLTQRPSGKPCNFELKR